LVRQKNYKVEIRRRAVEILTQHPTGLRRSALLRALGEAMPGVNLNTLSYAIWRLDLVMSAHIYKPTKGVYRALKFRCLDQEGPGTLAGANAKDGG